MRLPVHCCCDPARRLGWVDVPGNVLRRPGRHVSFLVAEALAVKAGIFSPPTYRPARFIDTEIDELVRTLVPGYFYICEKGQAHTTIPLNIRHLAVKSADKPIETWRQVKAFVEDPR